MFIYKYYLLINIKILTKLFIYHGNNKFLWIINLKMEINFYLFILPNHQNNFDLYSLNKIVINLKV